jgi:hypothetical protein
MEVADVPIQDISDVLHETQQADTEGTFSEEAPFEAYSTTGLQYQNEQPQASQDHKSQDHNLSMQAGYQFQMIYGGPQNTHMTDGAMMDAFRVLQDHHGHTFYEGQYAEADNVFVDWPSDAWVRQHDPFAIFLSTAFDEANPLDGMQYFGMEMAIRDRNSRSCKQRGI